MKNKIVCFFLFLVVLISSTVLLTYSRKETIQNTYDEEENTYFAIYVDDELTNSIPTYDSEYVFDSTKSNCTNGVTVSWNWYYWTAALDLTNYVGENNSRTKCTLYFKKESVIDYTGTGTITVTYEYDGNKLSGLTTKLYRVASVSTNGWYTPVAYYADYIDAWDINGLYDFEYNDVALTLYTYILDNGISPEGFDVSGDDGKATVNELSMGLYLVVMDEEENTSYTFNPTLVPLPFTCSSARKDCTLTEDYVRDAEIYPQITLVQD